MILLLVCAGWLCFGGISAQDRGAETKVGKSIIHPSHFDFVNYAESRIQFFGDPGPWNLLFSKLDNLYFTGEGKISILHIGGSHVQGGMLTDRLRADLMSMTDGLDGERGFFFPYKLAGTNSPRSIGTNWTGTWKGCRIAVSGDSCLWGMSGISATTTDVKSTVRVWTLGSDSLPVRFNRATLYFDTTDSSSFHVVVPGAYPLVTEETTYSRTYAFQQWQDTLSFFMSQNDSMQFQFALNGIYLGDTSKVRGISYHTIGVNGAGTYSYLRCPEFGKQIASLGPDLVVLGIGVNDANVPAGEFDQALFEARYDSLIANIRQSNPETVFLFITNNDTYYKKKRPNTNGPLVRESMIRLAKRNNAAVYDFFSVMGGTGSIRRWQSEGLAQADRIHLTRAGYEWEADMIYLAFRDAFGNYLDTQNTR